MAAVNFAKPSMQRVPCISIYPCMLLIVVHMYVVLCSEVYTTAPERSWGLNNHRTKAAQDQTVELCKSVLDFRHFCHSCPPLLGNIVFSFALSWSVLKSQLRAREERLCMDNWLKIRRRSIAKLGTWRKKVRPIIAVCNSLAGAAASSLLVAIFDRKKKNQHKTLNCVTVHL